MSNKPTYLTKNAKRRNRVNRERMALLVEYVRTHPCVDCGEADPLVLDFDHLRDKEFTIARAFGDVSLDNLLAEIAKCEVRCANCHRRKTAERAPSLRALMAAERML